MKKCPYCGRKISYFTVFHEKKHGKYNCTRCKKDCKVKTDLRLLLSFLAVVLVVVLYIVFWMGSSFHSNILGVIPPVVILVAFYFCTPLFIRFVPLKDYLKKDVKLNGDDTRTDTNNDEEFVFDRNIFEQIKQNRSAPSGIESRIDKMMEEEGETKVPVIKNVSEAHASSDAPLKRVQKPAPRVDSPPEEEEEVKKYVPKKEKPNGSKYTGNRKL